MANNDNNTNNTLRSLIYENGTLKVLDQLLLPHTTQYIPINNIQDAHFVISKMHIRGAPLIAIVALLGLAVDMSSSSCIDKTTNSEADPPSITLEMIEEKLQYILTSRPTAVNLANAINELRSQLTTSNNLLETVKNHSQFMLQRDVSDNRNIGRFGADAILAAKTINNVQQKATVVTICNTGSLATAGYGTALGVIRRLHENNKLEKAICLETRPYNQGSRLTSYECMVEDIPSVLICDSMIGSFMQHNQVAACVVGADRVAANGDTANKIGTYNLAVVAQYHKIPFFVASPSTTLDTSLANGSAIPIEERPPGELLETSRAPENMPVWNPGFDVTPASLIAGIITERGVIPNVNGTLDVSGFVQAQQQQQQN